MPMRFLDTRRRGDTRRFLVWLDTSKTTLDDKGATVPDPSWTAAIEFPATPPEGVAPATYRDDIIARVKGFARAALAERQAREVQTGTGLAIEGTDFV
jgi:hypothetical protein